MFLKGAGGGNEGRKAVIAYLEYICLECGPTRAAINENSLLNKRKDDAKKGIEAEKPTIHEQMLLQQDEIYTTTSMRSGTSRASEQATLEHVSAAELE